MMALPPWKDPTDLPPGAVIGERYRLDQPLGSGASSRIYAAYDLVDERVVALKAVTLHDADRLARERFERERRIAVSLRHPNLVEVLGGGWIEATGTPYLVMELLDGESLGERLLRGPILPTHLTAYVDSIADALTYVHAAGVVHRDVKPGNILLGPPGVGPRSVKLIDFGVSVHTSDPRLTASQWVVGTPSYLAPERLIPGGAIDHRVDLYSLGVVMYEALTGQLPFTGETPEALTGAIARSRTEPPSTHAPVSRQVDGVVMKAIARGPDERFQTARDLATAFRVAVNAPAPSSVDVRATRDDEITAKHKLPR